MMTMLRLQFLTMRLLMAVAPTMMMVELLLLLMMMMTMVMTSATRPLSEASVYCDLFEMLMPLQRQHFRCRPHRLFHGHSLP